ncbi:SUKH-4 family immunity protein [Streptomyces sp. SDT5-1]|uniref:SUKH-4 family immunity protein n=1 Tax=Streptomyces sp. SDT5-1 TaxID=3406418 RepID=UPI003FD35EBE
MANHEDLTSLFGADGVVTLGKADALDNGISEEDAETLAVTGLPAFLDVIFTLRPDGDPASFSILPVEVGGESVEIFCLGGPTDSPRMSYCLDLDQGLVILLSQGDRPGAEVVNSTLDLFIEFLYRFALRLVHVKSAEPDQKAKYTQELVEYLKSRDPRAFADPESWWSMVYDQLA